MWSKVALLALGASLLPLGACAQNQPDGGGPSPDMRAKIDTARGAAKDGSFAALTADHRAKVQALVDTFDADGSTATVSDTAAKIDAVLTKDESTAVLAQEQKMRDSMRAAFSGAGGPGGGPDGGGPGGGAAAPGGGPSGGPAAGMSGTPGGPGGGGPDGAFGGGHGGRGGRHHAPDAGRFLLQVDASQDRYREAMRAERGR